MLAQPLNIDAIFADLAAKEQLAPVEPPRRLTFEQLSTRMVDVANETGIEFTPMVGRTLESRNPRKYK